MAALTSCQWPPAPYPQPQASGHSRPPAWPASLCLDSLNTPPCFTQISVHMSREKPSLFTPTRVGTPSSALCPLPVKPVTRVSRTAKRVAVTFHPDLFCSRVNNLTPLLGGGRSGSELSLINKVSRVHCVENREPARGEVLELPEA